MAYIDSKPPGEVEIDTNLLEALVKSWLHAFWVISVLLLSNDVQDLDATEFQDLIVTRRKCLCAVFSIRHYLLENLPDLGILVDDNILGIIFPPSPSKWTNDHLFSPIFTSPKALIAKLQNPASKLQVRSPLGPQPLGTQIEGEAEDFLSLLDLAISSISQFPLLKSQVKNDGEERDLLFKREAEQARGLNSKASQMRVRRIEMSLIDVGREKELRDLRRPLRIGIELRLLRTDLVLSLATAGIKEVKKRVAAIRQGQSLGTLSSTSSEQGEDTKKFLKRYREDTRSASPSHQLESDDEEMIDVKPKIPLLPQGHDSQKDPAEIDSEGPKWEEEAEEELLGCLKFAKSILDQGHSIILTEKLDRSDWLVESQPVIVLDSSSGDSLNIPKHGNDSKASLNNDSDSDTDSDDDESTPSSSEEEEGRDSQPCPLRTLFRLHDRYEEQRLAIWLTLGTGREKMNAFMRGEGGRIGQAWDAMGLGLMIDFDR